jgi:hypothetical protein
MNDRLSGVSLTLKLTECAPPGHTSHRVRQRILATGVSVAGLCEAGGSRWAGFTEPGYNFRERMPETVGAPQATMSIIGLCLVAAGW